MLLRVFFCLLAAIPATSSGAEPAIVSEGPAALSGAREYVLSSRHAGRDFLIQVASPVRPLAPGEKAAVIYVLDGDYMFGMATDIARSLQIVREITPVYVVSIGYPGDSHAEWVTGRLHDMLRETVDVRGQAVGGGGTAFRRFIIDELRPFVEARYQIDPDRSYLAGHSLGGLFAAEVILDEPGAFAGYAIGSPSLWIRPQLVEQLQRNIESPARPRVFIGAGSEELEEDMVGWAERLAQTLAARGFAVSHRNFAHEGHVSVAGSLFANALKFLMPSS